MILSKSVGHSRNSNKLKHNQLTVFESNSRKSKVSTTHSELKLLKSNVTTNCKRPYNCVYSGKTIKFHENRRESFLNSLYNKRRNELLRITKVNRKIYDRINSQQSLYASRTRNQSSHSVRSNSSRVSNRSNKSKSSNGSRTSSVQKSKMKMKKETKRNDTVQPTFKAQNINSMKKEEIIGFCNMFNGKQQPQTDRNTKQSGD